MAILICQTCGADLPVVQSEPIVRCSACRTTQTYTKSINNEKIVNLFNRANQFRNNGEYDRAIESYYEILKYDPNDATAYWELILAKYGVEYVEEGHEYKITLNRLQFGSIYDDEDYKKALEHADLSQEMVFENDARIIDGILTEYNKIASQEEPFDIFISYKENDENGNRTQDSAIAYDVYEELTRSGYKVFYSRVTLEGVLGVQYEPYIFSALQSSKVMLVIGSNQEYLNSVWVKNEWSRFLDLAKKDTQRKIIPVLINMDPYNLPQELSIFQGVSTTNIAYIQDLKQNLAKLIRPVETVQPVVDVAATEKTRNKLQAENNVKRAQSALATRNYDDALRFAERGLSYDAESAELAWVRYLASNRVNDFQYILNNVAHHYESFFGDNYNISKDYIQNEIISTSMLYESWNFSEDGSEIKNNVTKLIESFDQHASKVRQNREEEKAKQLRYEDGLIQIQTELEDQFHDVLSNLNTQLESEQNAIQEYLDENADVYEQARRAVTNYGEKKLENDYSSRVIKRTQDVIEHERYRHNSSFGGYFAAIWGGIIYPYTLFKYVPRLNHGEIMHKTLRLGSIVSAIAYPIAVFFVVPLFMLIQFADNRTLKHNILGRIDAIRSHEEQLDIDYQIYLTYREHTKEHENRIESLNDELSKINREIDDLNEKRTRELYRDIYSRELDTY